MTRGHGFSLVEMMITLALGMIIMGAALGTYLGSLGANNSQMRMARLNGDLRIALTQITRDLRRAGYHHWSLAQLTSGDFMVNPQAAPTITATSADIRYDENSDGVADTDEDYGFRWVDSDGDGNNDTLQTRIGAGAWSNLTDPQVIRITSFAIVDNSPSAVNPAGAEAAVTIPVYSVSITGQLVADSSVQRSIRETVRVRNPILMPNP